MNHLSPPTVSTQDFSRIVFEQIEKSEGSSPIIVLASTEDIHEALKSMTQGTNKKIQDPAFTRQMDEEAVAVTQIGLSDLSKAIQSFVVPTAAGSPVGILKSQDDMQVLRRLSECKEGVLIVNFDASHSTQEMNIVAQFVDLRKMRELDISRTVIILNGDSSLLPKSLVNKSSLYLLDYNEKSSSRSMKP